MGIVFWRSGIMPIRNYKEAVEKYDSVEPIRGSGRNAGTRPLGYRNKPQFQLVSGIDRMHCKLYRHHVVTFHESGDITFDASYKSDTTARFISDVLNVGCSVRDNKLVLWLGENVYNVEGLELRNENGYLVPTRCKQDVVHTIDRKAMNAVRKEIKEFRSFLSGFLKIQQGQLHKDALADGLQPLLEQNPVGGMTVPTLQVGAWRMNSDRQRAVFAKFMAMVNSGEAENWHQTSLWLINSHHNALWGGMYRFTDKTVLHGLDEILIASNPHVLVRELVPAGQVKVDRYKKFKSFMEGEDE